jgi:hypothetical protein
MHEINVQIYRETHDENKAWILICIPLTSRHDSARPWISKGLKGLSVAVAETYVKFSENFSQIFINIYTRKNLTCCSKSANKPSTSCVLTACPKLPTSVEEAVKVYMQGKMKNLKFRNLERNDLP